MEGSELPKKQVSRPPMFEILFLRRRSQCRLSNSLLTAEVAENAEDSRSLLKKATAVHGLQGGWRSKV
jgi:hypothetical protein